MSSLVSFNILKTTIRPDGNTYDKNINPDGMPILYKSVDDNIPIFDEFSNNESLYRLLKENNIFNYVNYHNTALASIKYNIELSTFTEQHFNVQDLFLLSSIEEGETIGTDTLVYLIKQIYSRARGLDKELVGEPRKDIITMLKYIKKMYPNDFNMDMLRDSVFNAVENRMNYNGDNTAFMKKIYEKVFTDIELN